MARSTLSSLQTGSLKLFVSYHPGVNDDGFFIMHLIVNFLLIEPSTLAGACSFRIHAVGHLIINGNLEYLIVMPFTT